MDSATKKQVINRLKSVEGHVRGIERMVDEDVYCIDVIKQGIAVQRALEKVNGIILESHLQSCVTTAIRGEEPEERERVIGELLELFEAGSAP
jgi:DNA-binding FrmR family transcriptional regulator